MPWQLDRVSPKTYNRNPIAVAVAQLRFRPLVALHDRIGDIQEGLRESFPGYERVEDETYEFSPPDELKRSQETKHRIYSGDESISILLGTQSMTIESRNHMNRTQLLSGFQQAANQLSAAFPSMVTTRLGLKYINVINKAEVSADLGVALDWFDLIKESFLVSPEGILVVDDETMIILQYSSTLEPGMLALKCGVIIDRGGSNPPLFRMDIDRYTKDVGRLDEAVNQLDLFATDIYSLFVAAATPNLIRWMSGGKTDAGSA